MSQKEIKKSHKVNYKVRKEEKIKYLFIYIFYKLFVIY